MRPDQAASAATVSTAEPALKPSAKPEAALPLALANIHLSPESSLPLYEQICRTIRAAIEAGDLAPGAPMPTARIFAAALGLGKNTVVTAYSRLAAEGYIVSKVRRGTEVSKHRFAGPRATQESRKCDRPAEYSNDNFEIGYGAQRRLRLGGVSGTDCRPFALNVPDPALYPRHQLVRRLSAEFCLPPVPDARMPSSRFQSALAGYLRHMRGVQCEAAQVIPVTTLESAVDLTARVLIDPGHCVLMEEPANVGTWEIFRAAGAHVFPLPMDGDGADPGCARCPPPRLIAVSPSVNFPFGAQMSEARRLSLLALARSTGAIVLELDVGWELSWSARLRAVQGFPDSGHVIYFGSFYETLGPQIRISYLVVPPMLAAPFAEIARRIGHGPDGFVLSALAGFIEDNEYAVHVKQVRTAYTQRMRLAMDAFRRHVRNAKLHAPSGGFHLTATFDDDLDEERVAQLAEDFGLAVTPLSRFYRQRPIEKGLVLGLGLVPERNMEVLMRRLAAAIEQARTTVPPRNPPSATGGLFSHSLARSRSST